jgi:hypothetical protein
MASLRIFQCQLRQCSTTCFELIHITLGIRKIMNYIKKLLGLFNLRKSQISHEFLNEIQYSIYGEVVPIEFKEY